MTSFAQLSSSSKGSLIATNQGPCEWVPSLILENCIVLSDTRSYSVLSYQLVGMTSPRVGMLKRGQIGFPLHMKLVDWSDVARHFSINTFYSCFLLSLNFLLILYSTFSFLNLLFVSTLSLLTVFTPSTLSLLYHYFISLLSLHFPSLHPFFTFSLCFILYFL